MFTKRLDELTEEDLNGLRENETPESMTTEFKRELNLGDRKQKAEAAKDISAMANTAGGRIFYGIDERELADRSTVAGDVCPLTDGSLDSRLENVLLESIHPRPRFRMRKVPVGQEGFVLVLEIYPAYASELHMVTGFSEHRFYKRGEQRTILMTEPEIRECYARIAASRQALDTSMEKAIESELTLVPQTHESVLIIPWFGHRDLVNPQRFGQHLGDQIADKLFGLDWPNIVRSLKVVNDGYRVYGPPEGELSECRVYACIRRTGLVHLAESWEETRTSKVSLKVILGNLVAGILIADRILDQCAYWGPVRVIHRLRASVPFFLQDPKDGIGSWAINGRQPLPGGVYTHAIPEVNLREPGSRKAVLRELLHQIFQTNGQASCSWYDSPSGELKQEMEKFLPRELCKYLRED